MKKDVKSRVFKVLKITGLSVVFLLFLLFILPILFPKALTDKVKGFANEKLAGELSFTETHLSFFSHFPSLTLTLDDFVLKGSAPFEKDTLLSAQQVAFGINVKSIFFGDKIKIDKVFVTSGNINIKVNSKGQPNYNVYVSDSQEKEANSSSASLKLERIDIKKMNLNYDDKSTKILISAKGFNYLGKGDLNDAIFDLKTNAQIESFDFTMNDEPYLKNKKVNAELITKINTNSLAFVFEQNNLKINKLPVEFKGKFNFLKNGYALDFVVKSDNSHLNDFFTAMPPHYVQWLENTKITGKTDLLFELKGNYIASENKKPDVHFNMKIREGFIAHQKANLPAKNIFLNLDTRLPQLDLDQFALKIDSIYFDVGKDFLNGTIEIIGITKPSIQAKIKAKLDLDKLNQALGIQNLDVKGILNTAIQAKGVYDREKKQFPITTGNFTLQNGYLKTSYYPNPIEKINLFASAENKTGTFKELKIQIKPSSFQFENKPFSISASFENFEDIAYAIQAKGELDIEKIYKVFSAEGIDMTGFARVDVSFKGKQSDATNGNYANLENKGTMYLKKIKTTSNYLPKPFVIEEGTFVFNQNDMYFTNFLATYGQSDFMMEGEMHNVINFFLAESEVLKGNFSVRSNLINVDEFVSETTVEQTQEAETAETAAGVIVIPKRFDFNLTAAAQKVIFDEIPIEQLAGNLRLNQGKLSLQNTGFSIIGTKVNMSAHYFDESEQQADFGFSIKATDFDIKRAYAELPMFKAMVSAAEFAEGIVSLDYKIAGKLDQSMSPIYPSLVGGGILSVNKVKMNGYKLFNVVSKKTQSEGLTNPDLSKVDIKTTIKNNLIKIERFKFRAAGFRMRVEGESSFDSKLNLKMRLGLPPLGIIGIPIKVTGNQENPNIGIGKQTEDLEETEFVDATQIPNYEDKTGKKTQTPFQQIPETPIPKKIESPGQQVPETVKDSIRN
ncbi:AsmA family protein [Flavobacterium sp.]|uniref:AsmA family protein n=1 Tax=Flavobacterium sp. TaxID=239 RepID=UPI00261493D5|nr:AsmA family protein [Flavobacterium sp.]MDD2985066.1 AsmA family protein [Flavobacterium sp.]